MSSRSRSSRGETREYRGEHYSSRGGRNHSRFPRDLLNPNDTPFGAEFSAPDMIESEVSGSEVDYNDSFEFGGAQRYGNNRYGGFGSGGYSNGGYGNGYANSNGYSDPLAAPQSQPQQRSLKPPPTPLPPKEKARPAARSPAVIEIAPGMYAKLRGADETWEAIANDFYLPCKCFCCDSDIFCIQDADYVLCPTCRVVNPIEGSGRNRAGGVGLGFTYESLAQWQGEIIMRTQNRSRVAQKTFG